MKIKFILLTLLLLFSRGCDFYSTSLWIFENPSDETNPLSQVFGMGWTGLILVNLILVGFIIYGFYQYSFAPSAHKRTRKPEKLTDFVSELYFDEKGKFWQLFYRMPKNRKILIGHTGYVLIRVIIVASFLATIHNLCQYYNVPAYDSFRDFVGRPLSVIYAIVLLSLAYFTYRLWRKEYDLR
ncbi:MAG: hypothetical protein KDC80_24115 [Saprospiraceae bacterium]|nr:hypothetical protein [Saprospiraceae bacterium]